MAHELILTRLLDAPADKLFRCWTTPELIKQWFAPRPYTTPVAEVDLRPGGAWRFCLRSTETGKDLWQRGVFREVVAPERLVFTFAWEEAGERGRENLVTVTFAEHDGKTLVTFR